MDDKNKLIEKLGELSAKAYMFGRMYHIDEVTELTKDLNELVAKVFDYSPWHTGTPTEEGFWLVKYKCVVEGKYNGRLTYRAVKIEKDKIDGFAYESGGIGAEEYWKPIEYQKIDDLWRGEE